MDPWVCLMSFARSCPPGPPLAFGFPLSLGTPSLAPPTLTTRFLPADRQPWTDKHPDLLTCGRCLQTFPLEAITVFMDHKKLGCQPFSGPSPGQVSGETSPAQAPSPVRGAGLPAGEGAEVDRQGAEPYFPFLAPWGAA
jgi:hypothetical protein